METNTTEHSKYQNQYPLNHASEECFYLLENFTGTSLKPSEIPACPWKTRSVHDWIVSPSETNGSTLQSRNRALKNDTPSTVANFRPMHARWPKRSIGIRHKTQWWSRGQIGLTDAKGRKNVRITVNFAPSGRFEFLRLVKVARIRLCIGLTLHDIDISGLHTSTNEIAYHL
jgi:hypothetical protein